MRKLLSVGVLGAALVLASCSTTQVQNIETFLGQVQAYTAQVCKFVPTVATIIAIVNSGIGQVVGAVGTAICNAVPPASSAQFKALPRVNSGATPVNVSPVIQGWRV